MSFRHDLITGVFPGSNNQAGFESPAGNNERIIVAGPAADKVDDFKLVALRDSNALPLRFGNDRPISLDCNAVFRQIEMLE